MSERKSRFRDLYAKYRKTMNENAAFYRASRESTFEHIQTLPPFEKECREYCWWRSEQRRLEKSGETKQAQEAEKRYIEALVRLLRLYVSQDGWREGRPVKHLDRGAAFGIGILLGEILQGRAPTRFRYLSRGRPKDSHTVTRLKQDAAMYIAACRQGLISDKTPIATVCREYGVDRDTARRWANDLEPTHKELFDDTQLIQHLPQLLKSSGHQYRRQGGSWNAVWSRQAKRKKPPK